MMKAEKSVRGLMLSSKAKEKKKPNIYRMNQEILRLREEVIVLSKKISRLEKQEL